MVDCVEMQVRRATSDDAEAFAAVVAAVAAEDRWIGTEPPVDVEAFAERMRGEIEAGRDPRWVLEDDDGRVVGTMALSATARGVAGLGMCIVAEARGRGGGHLLMDTALVHALDDDLHKIELEVWPDNARAIALYEAYGFEVEGVRRDHYRRRDGTLRSSVIMARLLADAGADQSRPGAGT